MNAFIIPIQQLLGPMTFRDALEINKDHNPFLRAFTLCPDEKIHISLLYPSLLLLPSPPSALDLPLRSHGPSWREEAIGKGCPCAACRVFPPHADTKQPLSVNLMQCPTSKCNYLNKIKEELMASGFSQLNKYLTTNTELLNCHWTVDKLTLMNQWPLSLNSIQIKLISSSG